MGDSSWPLWADLGMLTFSWLIGFCTGAALLMGKAKRARLAALEEASIEALKQAYRAGNSAELGPEQNCVRVAEAIRALKDTPHG